MLCSTNSLRANPGALQNDRQIRGSVQKKWAVAVTLEYNNLYLNGIQRAINFPYPIMAIGYYRNNAPAKNVQNIFPDKIEITLRTLPDGTAQEKAIMTLGGDVYSVGYPHIIVKRPHDRFIYNHLQERDVFYFAYGTEQYDSLEKLGLFDAPLAWDITISPEIENIINELNRYLDHSRQFGHVDRIDIRCFSLLTECLLMKQNNQQSTSPSMDLIQQIDSYIRFHFSEDISLESTAARFSLSRSGFFQLWTQHFKTTPAKYIQNLRLHEACRLLTESNQKIFEIAELINIPDPAYFCAVFKKCYKLTPAEFRKKNQKKVTFNPFA